MSLMECGHLGNFLFSCVEVSRSFLEGVKVAQKLESTVQPVIGQCFRSSTLEDVDRVSPWPAFFERGLAARSARADCSVLECDEFIEKKLPSSGSTQHVCGGGQMGGWLSRRRRWLHHAILRLAGRDFTEYFMKNFTE